MFDIHDRDTQRKLIIAGAGLLVIILITVFMLRSCSSTTDIPSDSIDAPTESTATSSDATSPDSIHSDVEADTSDDEELQEFIENEEGLSDDIIRELQRAQEEEGVDPDVQADAWEQTIKDRHTNADTPDRNPEVIEEPISDEPQTDPNSEEYNRQFNNRGEMEQVIDSEGRLEDNIANRVEDAILPGSGPQVGENSSTTVNMRAPVIKDLYTTGTGDRTGDTILFGDLAVKVNPILSEPGYLVDTSSNTATLNFGEYGMVLITKVRDFDPINLSIANLMELGGITEIDSSSLTRPIVGTYTRYSYKVVDKDFTREIYYYQSPYGTYQFLLLGGEHTGVSQLDLGVAPDETINAMVPSDNNFELQE